jgi:hypothetical protein
VTKDLLTDPFAAPAEPTPDIIKNGRYWLPPVNDPTAKRIGWTRATTLVKTVSDMFLIDRYHQREIMIGLAKREDLYDLVCATDFDDKEALNKLALDVLEAAKSDRGYAGSEVGTAFHSATERLDRGEAHGLRPKWDAKLRNYEEAMGRRGFTFNPLWMERRVVCERYQVAGTFDRIAQKGSANPRVTSNPLHVTDLKTQKTFYTWWEIAAQLAIYANADAMWDEDQCRYVQMPPVDKNVAYVTWMPVQHPSDDPDAVDVYAVDIAKGWRAVDLIDLVRGLRKEGEKWGTLVPLTAPMTDEERFAQRILEAQAPSDLTKIVQEMKNAWSVTTIPAFLLDMGTKRWMELSASAKESA